MDKRLDWFGSVLHFLIKTSQYLILALPRSLDLSPVKDAADANI